MLRPPVATRLIGVVAPIALASGALAAQSRAPTDLDVASRSSSGAMVIVLDRSALEAGRGRTLADFLAGRVPGLQVAYESGQPSAAPRVISRASYGTFAPAEPLLYVDGVLWRDDPNWLAAGEAWALPSFGWQLLVDEIEEVRVHLGAASAALLEFGASRGVVLVTTRRPQEGAARVRASVQATTASYEPKPRSVVGRTSSTPVSPAWGCTTATASTGGCTPDTRFEQAAFGIFPMHGRSDGLDALVDGTGTLLGTRIRAAASHSRHDGTLPSSARTQSTLALTLERAFGARIDAAIEARAGRAETGVADRRLFAVVRRPFQSSPLSPDSVAYWSARMRELILRESPDVRGSRATIGGRARYRIGATTEIAVRASLDRYWRGQRDSFDLDVGAPGQPMYEPNRIEGLAHVTSANVGLRVARSHRFSSLVRGDFVIAGQVTNADLRDHRELEREVPPFGWLRNTFTIVGDSRQRSALGGARFSVGERLRVTGAVRHEATRGLTIAPSLQSLSGEYLLRRGAGDRRAALTLFGGYGESVDHRTTGARTEFGRPSAPEFTIERELGIRGTRGARLEATLSHARTRVSDGLLMHPRYFPALVVDVDADASWRVDATVATVALRARPETAVPWRIGTSVMRRDHVLLGTRSPGFLDFGDDASPSRTMAGHPLDEFVGARYRYADIDGDGILDPTEVTVVQPWNGLGGSEPRLILTLDGDAGPWRGLRVGATLEGRFGQKAFDAWAYASCRQSSCPVLFDSTASLAAQAAALAARGGSVAGFVHAADFVRVRELYVEAAPPQLGGARIRLAVHQLLAWTRFPGEDPEARRRQGSRAAPEVGTAQPLYPSVSLRIDLGH